MARINIEECWWSDPRRTALLLQIGFEADSAAVNMWRVAQEFYGKSRGLVPKSVFDKLKHSTSLIEAGLADVRDTFVYVRGCSEYLEWHAEKREQAIQAGKKSAEARRLKNGTAQPIGGKGHEITEREPNDIRTKVNGTEPSGSLSGSLSVSKKKNTNTNTLPIASQTAVPKPVKFYCDRYKEKYGHNPAIGGKQSGIIARFAKNHPYRWAELIEGYLRMPDSWAVARSHPVEMLESKVNEIVRFNETGKVVTKKVIEQAEELVDKAQGTSKRPRKSIEDLERERAEMMADANVVPMLGRGEK